LSKAKATEAKRADKYALYQKAVQAPDHEASFFQRVFRSYYGRPPVLLREDFCAAAALCCEWVKGNPRNRQRRAIGVDLDPEPLAWGREHNLAALPVHARERVELIEADARRVFGDKADVIAALNFSFYLFKTRDELRGYFEAARQNLGAEGILVCDMMGGWETFQEGRSDVRRLRNGRQRFTYVWEQSRFDPITHDCRFHIHFQFDDGSALNRAFTYDWRLWTIPEVTELMREAGFSRADVYWEGTDRKTGKGDGVWRLSKHAASDPAWIAVVVGVK
jgi:SAM-dependent methyltransferase